MKFKKFKATKKEMREQNQIISVGYCDLAYLLRYEEPRAYSAGVYGWDCDYYRVNDVIICTGYRPIKSKNTKTLDYDTINAFNEKAREIVNNHQLTFEEAKYTVTMLLEEFIKRATNG